MANLFVSHRGTDTAEADRLAKELLTCGHKVWLDAWDGMPTSSRNSHQLTALRLGPLDRAFQVRLI